MKEFLRWKETVERSKENESKGRNSSMYSTALGIKN